MDRTSRRGISSSTTGSQENPSIRSWKKPSGASEMKPNDFFAVLFVSSIVIFLFITFAISSKTPDQRQPNEDNHLSGQFPNSFQIKNFKSEENFQTPSSNIYKNNSCLPFPSCMLPPREPIYVPLCDLLRSWSPNIPDIHGYKNSSIASKTIGQFPIARFNFSNSDEYMAAMEYREKEIPFVIYNIPELEETRRTWTDKYLKEQLKQNLKHTFKIEKSTRNGHLLYHRKSNVRGYIPPQEEVNLSYDEFEDIAIQADVSAEGGGGDVKLNNLYYLTISAGMGGITEWIASALSYFKQNIAFFRVNYPEAFHGINCRFGMKGIVQAAHYDHGRNFISMIRGNRRYVILHPRTCPSLELLGRPHPSARHASFDWADPEELDRRSGTPFCAAEATELILSAGDTLYLPSYWFHYIVSLDRTIQCNSRSGNEESLGNDISKCMRSGTIKDAPLDGSY